MKAGRKLKRKDDELIEKLNQKYAGDKVVPYMGNANLPSDKSTFEYDKERVAVIRRCSENILYFAQHFFYIVNLDEGKQKINLHPFQRDALRMFRENKKSIMCCSRQVGKALALDTLIPTPDGFTTMGKLKDGDFVLGSDGEPVEVAKAWPIMYDRECYELKFDTGEKIIADGEHNWITEDREFGEIKKRTTKEIYDTQRYKFTSNHRIPTCQKFHNTKYNNIISVKKVDSVPVRCITVKNEDEIFLCGKSKIMTKNTTLMTIYALWLITFYEYQRVVIVANKEKTAQEILERIKLAYEELPNWLKPQLKDGGWNKQEINFSNGCKVQISATSESAIRGKSCNALIIDEMSHIEPNIMKAFWSAVYPVISSSKKSKALIASTPNGVGNKFHELWDIAENPESDWANIKVSWRDVPGKTEEWAKQERLALGDDMFEQEYECKFLESGESFIPEELYNDLQRSCTKPRIDFDGGDYKIFEEPDVDNRIYCAGVDIAEGVGECNSTICVLDVTELTNVKQVATYASNTIGPHEFARKLNEIMKHWGKPPLAIERNNSGGGVVINQMEKEYNYPHLINFAVKQGKLDYGHLKGVTSSTNTKYHGVMNMFYWLKTHRRVSLRDIDTLKELNTFVRHKNEKWGRRSDSYKDDRVDALIWALIAVHELCVNQYFSVIMYDDNRKPLQIAPQYTPYGTKDSQYLLGTEEDNWGADKIYIGGDSFDPFMDEMQAIGWLTPEQDRQLGWSSYQPAPQYR